MIFKVTYTVATPKTTLTKTMPISADSSDEAGKTVRTLMEATYLKCLHTQAKVTILSTVHSHLMALA